MEPWIWDRMIWSVGLLCLTYLPLQIAAIWRQRGVSRIAAGLPMLFMVPLLVGACRPDAYRDGSLFGMYFYCPYLPVMFYLAVAVLSVPPYCPHCGKMLRRRSFQRLPADCPHCGGTRDAAMHIPNHK